MRVMPLGKEPDARFGVEKRIRIEKGVWFDGSDHPSISWGEGKKRGSA